LSRGDRCWRRCGRGGGLLVGLADIDAALEECAVFNADTGRGHVAGQGAFGTDVHAVGGGDVAAHLAQDNHFARGDAGGYLAVPPHRHAVAVQVDAALDFTVDNNDSDPVISPLMKRPLLMLAWSADAVTPARLAESIGEAVGAGRTGSGGATGGDGGSGWLGFHIRLYRFLSLSARDSGLSRRIVDRSRLR